MWRYVSLWCAFALAGCAGQQSISLQAQNTQQFPADGATLLPLSASVIFRGAPVPDGTQVTYSTALPLLFTSVQSATPAMAGASMPGAQSVTVTSSGGSTTAYLQAPTTAQPIIVTVSFTTVDGDVLATSLTITPQAPALVAGSLLASSSCASATTQNQIAFDFMCTASSIGAFVSGRGPISVPCTLVMLAQNGNSVPFTPVRFFSEAGQLVDIAATAAAPRQFVYVVTDPPTSLPVDVAPMPDETSLGLVAVDTSGYIPNALQQNPRDGLVTLLAVVRGQEGFDDLNGNGVYDAGEPFCDEGEPFLDVDDDGVYSAAADVACCDNNANGQVDGPNGVWDSNVWLGRSTHILWTGGVSAKRSGFTALNPNGAQIPLQGSAKFSLAVMDRNFNPVASAGSADAITLTVTPTPQVGFNGTFNTTIALSNTLGMVVVDRFPHAIFGSGAAPYKHISAADDVPPGNRSWSFSLVDERQSQDDGLCQSFTWVANASVLTTLAPSSTTNTIASTTVPLATQGSLSAKAPTCP